LVKERTPQEGPGAILYSEPLLSIGMPENRTKTGREFNAGAEKTCRKSNILMGTDM
jgi:hypothetical protein